MPIPWFCLKYNKEPQYCQANHTLPVLYSFEVLYGNSLSQIELQKSINRKTPLGDTVQQETTQ